MYSTIGPGARYSAGARKAQLAADAGTRHFITGAGAAGTECTENVTAEAAYCAGAAEPHEFLVLLTARELRTARRLHGCSKTPLRLQHNIRFADPVEVDSSHDHRGCVGSETVLRSCLEHVRKGQTVCEDAVCCTGAGAALLHGWCRITGLHHWS